MPAEMKKFSIEEVSEHNSREDIWMIYKDKVYDVTKFLEEHPGGEEVLLEQAGVDATGPFDEIGHSPDAHELLEKMLIGELDEGSKQKIVKESTTSASNTKSSASSSSSSSSKPVVKAQGGSDISSIVILAIPVLAIAAYCYLNN